MFNPKRGRRRLAPLLAFAVALGLSFPAGSGESAAAGAPTGYYHTSGNRIVDSNGDPAIFNGISWFGFETSNYSPHGLWARSLDSYLDEIKNRGYNLIRLPFSSQMFDPGSTVNSINAVVNPDLVGLTPLQLMDKVVQEAGERGIQIFLDRHRPDSGGQSELWYTAQYSEQRWIDDWKMLAARYANNPTVIGADLHNEPHGTATWGTGDPGTDWRLAAERAGNAILSVNPNWLIIVEGIQSNVRGQTGSYWWGGNLKGVRNDPVRLNVPNRVVYSPHDYGPGVAQQTWFEDPSFPNNLPALWDSYWGYISKENIAPILVGEFGGRSVDAVSKEGRWQNELVDYIQANDLYWAYWCLNPNSGDTGGLLLDDWTTWNAPKQTMLNRIMKPLSGGWQSAPQPPSSLTATAGDAKASLSWPASGGAASYNVKRAATSGGPYATVASGVTATSYADTGLANGTTYYYVVSAANAAGEGANSPEAAVTPQAGSNGSPGSLVVQYKANQPNPAGNQITAQFNIKNNGASAASLSGLKLRYYFTKEGAAGLSFFVDYAAVGSSNVGGAFAAVSPAKPGADTYLEISFGPGAGSIAPGGQSGDIQIRAAKTDWSNFDQSDDYSFLATQSSYADWTHATLYENGALVWGTEP